MTSPSSWASTHCATMGSVLLGGVSHRLIHRAACPVIVVPRGTERAIEALTGARTTEEAGHA